MKILLKTRVLILLLILVLEIAILTVLLTLKDYGENNKPIIGVTFSKVYVENDLGLDWRQAYLAILDDLQIKNIRIAVPWNKIAPTFGQYEFQDYDWMMEMADERGVKVILAIGHRTPRWPECHTPDWLRDLTTEKADIEQQQMIADVVTHFKKYSVLWWWQIENEPFLDSFGECPPMSIEQLKKEIAIVKSLDSRPILITDSGELSFWFKTGHLGDKFGHTLYREVYNQYLGFFRHVFPPSFYWLKARMVNLAPSDVIVAELQAEPWVPYGYNLTFDSDQLKKMMTAEKLSSNFEFARRTGAREIYFWGVEWWYWLKEKQNDPSLWQEAKKIINQYK